MPIVTNSHFSHFAMLMMVEVGGCWWSKHPRCGAFYHTLFFCTEVGLPAEFLTVELIASSSKQASTVLC